MDARMDAQITANQYKEKMVGKKYLHFKGGVYVVDDIVVHSETAELLVVYSSYLQENLSWARPLNMFLSKVDKEKYPDVEQEMRFEEVEE